MVMRYDKSVRPTAGALPIVFRLDRKGKRAVDVGVPERTPAEESVNPEGRLSLVFVNV
jgi:hypothetical protein